MARIGAPGVIAGKFTVVGWPKTKPFGQAKGERVTAAKSTYSCLPF